MSEYAAPPLVIRLFGPFEVLVDGDPLRTLRSRKGQWLLALLTFRHGCEVERSWLAGMLWPESSEVQALHSLRSSLSDLRQALGPEAARLGSRTSHTISLDLAGAEADVVSFEAALASGDGSSLERAIALYRGPLLEGCTEEWVHQERRTREERYLGALEALSAHARAGGDGAQASHCLRRVVAADPLRESAQRALMEVLMADGNYAAATQTYRDLRLLLHRELNAEPDAATTELYQQIRAQARRRAAPSGAWPAETRSGGVAGCDSDSILNAVGADSGRMRSGRTVTFLFIEVNVTESRSSRELDNFLSMAGPVDARASRSVIRSRRISREARSPAFPAPSLGLDAGSSARHSGPLRDEEASVISCFWKEPPELDHSAPVCLESFLYETIRAHGGELFTVSGSRCSAVFAAAPEALAAALAIRRGMEGDGAARWRRQPADAELPSRSPIDLRMALHAGIVEEGNGTCTGSRRLASLLEAASAGQILLSQAARDLLRDSLPAGVGLRQSGERSFPDTAAVECVFHLVIGEGAVEPVVGKGRAGRRHNLPVQRTSLVGREDEIAAACELLRRDEVGLVTMTGPGGAGKTRLGIQVATELLEEFGDGVWFVSLASVSDPEWVIPAMAQALGVRESTGQPLWESLVECLREQHLLLLLDNFEQVLAAAPHMAALLAAAPRLKLLITSRAVLRLREEHEFPVPPLPVPVESGKWRVESQTNTGSFGLSALPSPLTTFLTYASVQLFVDRARAVKLDFALTEENAPAVAAICRRLDGLPLAIELAAARTKLLSPQALLARLVGVPPGAGPVRSGGRPERLEERPQRSPLQLLTGGARDLPARQQTLRGAIASSYQLLDPSEQALFRRLSVFVGGCSLEAAEAVCGEVLDGMASLVDNSLLRREEGGDGEARFLMLETIREYGRECLEASGEAAAIQKQHADYFLGLVEQWAGSSSDWIETEYDNLRAALTSYREQGEGERGYRLGAAMWQFWYQSGTWTEGRERLVELLERSGASPQARAGLLRKTGQLAWLQNDYTVARSLIEQSVALFREQEIVDSLPASLNALGQVARTQGDYETARSLFEESLVILRAQGDTVSIAWALQALGELAQEQGDAAARALLEESLALFRECGDEGGIAVALSDLGEVARVQGELQAARSLHEQSLMIRRAMGHKAGIARALGYLGAVAAAAADVETAHALYAECLHLLRELGDRKGMAACLERFAALAVHSREIEQRAENRERAARLFGAAAALRDELGAPQPPAERADHDRNLAAARAALGEAAFGTEWSKGRSMPLEQAVRIAREIGC